MSVTSDAAAAPQQQPTEQVPIFSRKATGLVRQVSMLQQIVFNLASSNALGQGLVFFLAVVVLFPSANIYVALIIAAVMSFFVWTTFGLLSGAIPRIGGDYTINSRVLPPWLALGGNVGSFMGGIFGVPIFGYFMATFALSPALGVIGGVTGSDTITKWSGYFAADHKTTVFITTLVVIAIMSALAWRGTRLIMRVCTVLVMIAAAGFLIDILILLFTSHDSFVRDVDKVAGAGAFDKTVAAGDKSLYPDVAGYNTHNTIGAVYYALTITIYVYWGAYLSAEFKGGGQRRRQLTAMWTAGIGNAVILLIALAIFMSTVGYDFFVSAFSGNFEAPGSAGGVGNAGYVYFSSLVANNDLLVTLLALAFLGWFLPACYTQAAMCQRALMTWSFDGLLPRKLSAVSPTRHTPTNAIIVTALLSIPLAVWICYSDNFFQYFAIAAVSAYPSLVLVGFTATIIKRRRPDLYKGSAAEWRVAGIEVLPVVGVLCSLVGAAAIALLFIYHTEVGLQYTTETAIYLVAMFVVGAVWWAVARSMRRNQGINLDLAYKEIPPE
jgi:APA family basic amino acid/polyamine antiporter